jgi:predicted nucleotidyltransferase
MQQQELLNTVEKMLGNDKLLYLTEFGSRLYGTHTANSDRDYLGVFLPSEQSLLLKQSQDFYSWQTKDNQHQKSTSDDVEIKLISIHRFLEDLSKGELQAIDLFYSSNSPSMIYDQIMDLLKIDMILDKTNIKPYIGYCQKQAAKYGIKGSRINQLETLLQELETIHNCCVSMIPTLCYVKDEILELDGTSLVEINGIEYIEIFGKKYQMSSALMSLIDSLLRQLKVYGDRAHQARNNQNIDWKALSHAVRVIYQYKELERTKTIRFPLECAPLLKSIKAGELPFQEVSELIERELASLLSVSNTIELDRKYKDRFILSLY